MIDAITQAAIDELVSELQREVRQPGDVSVMDLEKSTNLSYKTVQDRMKAKIEAGLYTEHDVFDPNTKRPVHVYRKVVDAP